MKAGCFTTSEICWEIVSSASKTGWIIFPVESAAEKQRTHFMKWCSDTSICLINLYFASLISFLLKNEVQILSFGLLVNRSGFFFFSFLLRSIKKKAGMSGEPSDNKASASSVFFSVAHHMKGARPILSFSAHVSSGFLSTFCFESLLSFKRHFFFLAGGKSFTLLQTRTLKAPSHFVLCTHFLSFRLSASEFHWT